MNQFGIAHHEYETIDREFWEWDELVGKIKKGDGIEIWTKAGGGGGHKIYIRDFEIIFSDPIENQMNQLESNVT